VGVWPFGFGGNADREVVLMRLPLNHSIESKDKQPPGVLMPGFSGAPPGTI
jgi:hypothetical protein